MEDLNSILQDERRCFVTGDIENLHKHHIFRGIGRRKLSEKYGCWVWLRWDWHNGESYGVHNDPLFDKTLKQACQEKFEETHTREEFIRIFGRSYL